MRGEDRTRGKKSSALRAKVHAKPLWANFAGGCPIGICIWTEEDLGKIGGFLQTAVKTRCLRLES